MDSILEYTPIAQFALGPDHRITHWNRACELLTGLASRDIIGTDRQWIPFYPSKRPVLADLVLENDFTTFFEIYHGRDAGPSNVIPDAWKATDFFDDLGGKSRYIFFLAAPVFDPRGRRVGAVETLQDITERVLAENRLRASEERYRFLTEKAADGIVVIQNERLVFANGAASDLFDCPGSEDLLERPLLEFIVPADRGTVKEMMQDYDGLKNADRVVQLRCISMDGQEFWVEAHNRAVEWQGRPAVIATLRDATESRRRESEILDEAESLRKENVRLRSSIRERYRLGGLVGKSAPMQEVYELILKAASSGANVLLSGESGTGKELAARAIHDASPRKEKPFVAVNCGAIPEPLLESEFFGHRRGAFTGAQADKMGFLDLADGGTLFLDEVGDLPASLQVKLLRALEGGGYTSLGSYEAKYPELVVFAATNRDLRKLVQEGRMREDFYYRIHVLPIPLPPLRERLEDLPLLVEHFLNRAETGKAVRSLPSRVMEAFEGYDWPGNVRELQNVLQRYITLNRLDLEHTSLECAPGKDGRPESFYEGLEDLSLRNALASFERRLLRQHLDRHRWQRSQVAARLGISRKTLFRKMKALGLSR